MLHEAARKLRTHFDDVVEVLTLEEGKAISENEEEVEWTIGTLDYYAELARHSRGRVVPPGERSQFNFVLKEPYGVVGCCQMNLGRWSQLSMWDDPATMKSGNPIQKSTCPTRRAASRWRSPYWRWVSLVVQSICLRCCWFSEDNLPVALGSMP